MKFATLNACLLLLLISTAPFAQTRPRPVKKDRPAKYYPPLGKTWWLTINPLTLAEPETAIALTVSYKMNDFTSVSLEAGTFLAYNNVFDYNGERYNGFRFKPEIKFFPAGEKRSASGFYLAARGIIKLGNRQREEMLDKLDNNGQVIFSQLVNYTSQKWVWGLSTLAGAEIITGPNKRFMIDVFGGIGLRYKKFSSKGVPDGFAAPFDTDRDRFLDLFQTGWYPALSLGFKFGYRISKDK